MRREALRLRSTGRFITVPVFAHHERAEIDRDPLEQYRFSDDDDDDDSGGVGPQRMAHAKLIKHMGGERQQVGDDQVCLVDAGVQDRVDAQRRGLAWRGADNTLARMAGG
jgi:hypothetical protein